MADLQDLLESHVGAVPGAVGLVARGDQVEVAVAGCTDVAGTTPMTRDTIFRIASITKPITAAAVMMLVDDGRISLDEPVARWLPELAEPVVVRTPESPIDDVVPARRAITVFDLLSSTAGYGFAADFALPAVQALFTVQKDGREPQTFLPQDDWLAALGKLPLLYQPGAAFLYDTCSTIQAVLVARVSGQSLPDFLAERVFEPLGMVDTAFHVPAAKLDRFTSYYRVVQAGLELADAPGGQWSTPPPLPNGGGGLVGTADDWLAFGRMLLAGGVAPAGRRLLTDDSVRLMTTDHTSPPQREPGGFFLDGQGWGFGGGVDITAAGPGRIPGRYGWVGGTGTSAHIVPATGTVAILLTQVGVDSPLPQPWLPDFWRYAAR